MTTITDLAKQIDSLPDPISKTRVATNTEVGRKARADAAKKGGKFTTIIFSPESHSTVKWALATPGGPRTQNQVVAQALDLYAQHHRGGQQLNKFWSAETRAKVDRMLATRPNLTETELVDLAMRHLFWSFENSEDGMVDT